MAKLSKRAKTIIFLGILVSAVPYLGIPIKTESKVITLLGIAIIISMYWSERRVSSCDDCAGKKEAGIKQHNNDVFKENNPLAPDDDTVFVEDVCPVPENKSEDKNIEP